MFDLELAIRLGAAVGLGLLLGLELERKRDAELLFGGVRTFALIALLGALGAFIERELGQSWLIVAAFIAVSRHAGATSSTALRLNGLPNV